MSTYMNSSDHGSDSEGTKSTSNAAGPEPTLKRRHEVKPSSRPSLLPLGGDEADNVETYGASHFGQFGEYMRRKRAKLQIQNTALVPSGHEDGIFKGLSIHVEYSAHQPSVQELRLLIVQNGGTYQPYLDKKSLVTHVVTCSLTPAKLREYKNMRIVFPTWIVNSVKEGKLLPWHEFKYLQESPRENSQEQRIEQKTLLSFATTKEKQRKTEPVGSSSEQLGFDPAVPYAVDRSNRIAQKALANPEWRRVHTSAAPDFVEGYYRNSRLHYLSTWKAELRVLIAEAQDQLERVSSSGTDSGASTERWLGRSTPRQVGPSATATDEVMFHDYVKRIRDVELQRVIMHCDFDCFFVSVGLVSNPHLRGKPAVVCHSQGTQGGASSTSEVASASYEARKQGVRNGMSLQQARKLCPTVMTMPYEFERYKELSLQFYSILLQIAEDVQAVSVDEALIDVTGAVRDFRDKHCCSEPCDHDIAKELAENIRARVRQATGCEISVGVAHNILLARLATRHAKPAGSFHLSSSNKTEEEILEFLSPLDISDLPGFGSAAKSKALERLGSSNVGKLREYSKNRLCEVFGPGHGSTLWEFLRGKDSRPLERDGGRRSVSCDINYGIRFADNSEAEQFVYQMAKEVKKRLDDVGMHGSLITLKVLKRSSSAPIEPPKFLGCGQCDSFTKQTQLSGPGGGATSNDQAIGQCAWRLLKSFHFDPQELRGIGIQIQRLVANRRKDETKHSGGQTLLPFSRKELPPDLRRKSNISPDLTTVDKECESTVAHEAGDRGGEKMQDPGLQPFSQANFTIYDALPLEVKRELDEQLNSRVQAEGPSKSVLASDAASHDNQTLKRIVHQPAPRTIRPSLSPRKSVSLGIDPAAFFGLPEIVQQEQVARARSSREGEMALKKVLKPRKPSAPPADLRPRLSPLRANFGAEKLQIMGENSHSPDAQEIQDAISDWVERYRHWAPKEKDVNFFGKRLMRCVVTNDGGIEGASTVLKWWLVLLRKFWSSQESLEELEGTESDQVGKTWWEAFRSVKEKLDAEVRASFGAPISLR